MTKTLVIFDIDGTLLHSNKVDSECFAQTYETHFGKTFPSINWQEYPHVTDHTIFNEVIEQHFGRKATAADIQKQQTHFVDLLKVKRREQPDAFMEVPGAVSTVNRLLQDEQFVVGIGTGGWQTPAMVKLNHLNFPIDQCYASYADNKTTREDILSESVEKARMAHSNIGRIVYVGDAVWDVRTTRNMQMDFVGIRIKGDLDFLRKEGAETVLQNYLNFDHFAELLHIATPPSYLWLFPSHTRNLNRFYLAMCYLETNDYDLAEPILVDLTDQLDPAYSEAIFWYRLLLLLRKREVEGAEALWQPLQSSTGKHGTFSKQLDAE